MWKQREKVWKCGLCCFSWEQWLINYIVYIGRDQSNWSWIFKFETLKLETYMGEQHRIENKCLVFNYLFKDRFYLIHLLLNPPSCRFSTLSVEKEDKFHAFSRVCHIFRAFSTVSYIFHTVSTKKLKLREIFLP